MSKPALAVLSYQRCVLSATMRPSDLSGAETARSGRFVQT